MIEDIRVRDAFSEDDYYQGIRQLFSEDYQHLSDAELESIVYDRLAEMSPLEAESFLSGLGNVVKGVANGASNFVTRNAPTIASVAQTALPLIGGAVGSVVAPGVGTAIGSQLGSLAGNFAGQGLSRINRSGRPMQAGPSNAQSAISGIAGSFLPLLTGGAGGPLAGGGQGGLNNLAGSLIPQFSGLLTGGRSQPQMTPTGTPATSQLMALIQNPQLMQSLLGAVMGGATPGRRLGESESSESGDSLPYFLEALEYLVQEAQNETEQWGYGTSTFAESADWGGRDVRIQGFLTEVYSNQEAMLEGYDEPRLVY
ncbi:hypothetical protein [Spirosoma sp.]|uniref:hypothetical protein n=1 Tax=Spirosoma sp. TaxID=1899569 RepID=UPI00260E7D9C|nr:hypothetical protein [Spirosoma sp.]MCX6215276.1 hypothetical protein [Spirosoma sp.]